MNNVELAIQFFLQLAVILVACRVVGAAARWLGQPQVVAEMITGVLLGPSLFGVLWPQGQQWLFPWDVSQTTRDTQSYFFPASQLGLALYMFIVGLEFRVEIIRRHYVASLAVSLAGMVAPFILGAILAVWLFYSSPLFGANTSLYEAALFLGASLSITAFPMLARIIHFQGLAGTPMGTIALGAGAIDDAAAWCLLALVLASFDRQWERALVNIGAGVGFVVVAVFVGRPVLRWLSKWVLHEDQLTDTGLALALACMALGAWFTDWMGLHAVFGSFVTGAIMPRGSVSRDIIRRIQPLTVALLLPLFFTYSGLNTQITLLNSWYLWAICVAVLTAAIVGKGVACGLAARTIGLPLREALGIGTLMNSRGLMELIIINIGLQRRIISPELFAILVIMAVVTTLMASPLFRWLVPPPPDSPLPVAPSRHPAPYSLDTT